MDEDKGLKELGGEPMVAHVIRRLRGLVDEVILVVGSDEQKAAYSSVVNDGLRVISDVYESGSPLVGAITGLRSCRGDYAFITACDMPFISGKVIRILFEAAEGHNGAVFQWPNGWIEPLVAVYKVEPSLRKAQDLYDSSDLRIRKILLEISNVNKIKINILKNIDSELLTLFDADTKEALRKAESILGKVEE
jgi:molybdopterin-guanine dinucleotide biosynthesis protein A